MHSKGLLDGRPRDSAPLAALARRIVRCQRCPRLLAHCRRVAREKKRAFASLPYWGQPVPVGGGSGGALIDRWSGPPPRMARIAPGACSPATRAVTGCTRRCTASGSGLSPQPRTWTTLCGLMDCWITAAARCAPSGNRSLPIEVARCRPYLEAELRLLSRIRVVLVLGRMAHDAFLRAAGWWERLEPRQRRRFAHGSRVTLPDGRILVSSYHPSRQNTNTGKLTRAMWHDVFRRVCSLLATAPVRASASARRFRLNRMASMPSAGGGEQRVGDHADRHR